MNVHCPLILVALLAAARVVPAQDVADSATVVRVLTVHDGRVVPQVLIVVHPADSSGRPVANAGRPAAVLTDDGGRATVRLAADLNALVASRLGFVPETLVVSRARASGILEIELEEASSELEEIVVTSTRGARRVEDEPLRVEVLPREEIEEKLLMTPGDITMMLNETGGLRVQVTSPSLGAAGVRIQGLPARYAQVLADGLPLHGETGSLGLLQIPPMDLGQDAGNAVEEAKAANPETVIELDVAGNTQGDWDSARIGQVLSNLLGNAVCHGSPETPIKVFVRGEGDQVVLQVHNRGPAIPKGDIAGIFSPFKRLRSSDATTSTSSLGLGLYIAERIVAAHGGTIAVTSSKADGTTVTARLPR